MPTVPPLDSMADAGVLDHLHRMHGYRMPCCVTTDEHDRDHQRTDRNVPMDVEPHTHQATLAIAHDARNAVYDREFDGKPRPWVPDASDLEQEESED